MHALCSVEVCLSNYEIPDQTDLNACARSVHMGDLWQLRLCSQREIIGKNLLSGFF